MVLFALGGGSSHTLLAAARVRIIFRSFFCLQAEIFDKSTKVCVLSVDLYDTTTDQDVVIREELVKERMAWPQFLSSEKEAKIFLKVSFLCHLRLS
jgi:hypothetical protein